MNKWFKMMRQKECEIQVKHRTSPILYENIEVKLIKKCVDDVFATLYKMKLGTEWDPSHGMELGE